MGTAIEKELGQGYKEPLLSCYRAQVCFLSEKRHEMY